MVGCVAGTVVGGVVVGGAVVGGTVVGGTVVGGIVVGGTVASVDGIVPSVVGAMLGTVEAAVIPGSVAPESGLDTQLLKTAQTVAVVISRRAKFFIRDFIIIPSSLAYFIIIGLGKGKVNRIVNIRALTEELHGFVQLLLLFIVGMKGRREMEQKNTESLLKKRIRSGKVRKEDVIRRLAELAFGKVNDCVKLVLDEDVIPDKLDLSLLSEVKRNDKGTVEVRLVDRLKALEQLALLAEADGGDLESFLKALQGGEEEG